jgi:hemolysin activation/secretion protein
MPDEIQAYWLPSLNKAVPGNEIGLFKAWLWEQLQAKGMLAYVNTTAENTGNGSVLKIKVSAPTLGRVSVLVLDQTATQAGSRAFADEVAKRFSKSYAAGSPVDVQGMSARLNAIAYDLPVTLEAALRQPDAASIDVVINMRLMPHEPGRLALGVVQLNNHGLKAYGREQALTQLKIQGHSPLTEYGAVAQVSKGVAYLSASRTAAIEGWQSRSNLSASVARTNTKIDGVSVKSNTQILGGGATTLVASDRDSNTLSNLNLSRRTTSSKVSGAVDTERSDIQLAANLKISGAPQWITSYEAQVMARLGQIGIENTADRDPRSVAGPYQILETSGELRQAVSKDRRSVAMVRWRAQKAFQNLDSYNQISLGGVNGIRAYTSSDGVGDEGAQVSLEFTHSFKPSLYVGVLYDVGRVTQNIKAVSGSKPNPYTLSGAGFQMGGNQGDWSWSAVLSKGLESTEPFETAVTEKLQQWRGLFALNRRF